MLLSLLILLLAAKQAICVGYMSSIGAMWISTTPVTEYAVCVLQAQSLEPYCAGTFRIDNNTIPPTGVAFWSVSSGGYFTCGLEYKTKFVKCWGQKPGSDVPSEYQKIAYSDLNSGGWHACAVRDGSDQVDCWGSDNFEQTQVPINTDFMKVSAGDTFTCGLSRSSSRATCWGRIAPGNVTLPNPQGRYEDIYAGREHVCGIEKDSGKTLCWGDNSVKQSEPPEGIKLSVITAGYRHTCGLRDDTREAVCWGDNNKSQLAAPEGVKFATIAAGDWYTCGVKLDMEVSCWGTFNQSLNGVKVSGGLCTSQPCGTGQFADTRAGQCPSSSEFVCLDCSSGPCRDGLAETSSCNQTSDRICGLPAPPPKPGRSRIGIVLGCVFGGSGVAVVSGIFGFWLYRKRRYAGKRSTSNRWDDIAASVVPFSGADIRAATRNYGVDMVIGKGAFGMVYKGILPTGEAVAIKRATAPERASSFEKELELLARLNHSNLVNLVGYSKEEEVLVFEYMDNGSLYDCLFKNNRKWRLDLVTRLRIALQSARGIEYLHVYASPRIIHRDVKSANILLDKEWNAHVADFGLAMSGPVSGASHLSNITPEGTPGYIDPEYFQSLQLTSKSDVYSFGVVLLELVTGQKAVSDQRASFSLQGIVSWVSAMQEHGHSPVDAELDFRDESGRTVEQVLNLALRCTNMRSSERPSMSFIVRELEELLQTLVAAAPSSSDISSSASGTLKPLII